MAKSFYFFYLAVPNQISLQKRLPKAAGVGKMWFSSSFSFTWTNTTATDEPVALNNGLRVGLLVYSRNRKHSGAIWIGVNYQLGFWHRKN